MSRKAKRGVLVGALITVLVVVGIAGGARQLEPTEKIIPTTQVQRGEVEISVFTTGEFRAPHSAMLVGPQVNGTLQIIAMLTTGTKVKAGDVVVEFDPSEQEYNYEQADSQFRQSEQEIVKSKADAAVQAAQDQTALVKAKFDVRRSELEVQRNELLSEIDIRKNNLALEEAKRKLKQLEEDVKSRALAGQAGLEVVQAKRDAARLAMQVAKTNIENMTVKSPIDGVVSAKENRDANGGFCCPPGMVLPEYRAGDLTFPGRPLAEVLDLDHMEVQAKISETDRANVSADQKAEVRVDAHPGLIYPARVKSVAGLAARDRWSNESSKLFDTSFLIDQNVTDLKPGVSALVVIHGNKLNNVLYLPPQCLFDRDGKQIIYAKTSAGFEPREVQVKYRTETRVIVEGVNEGLEVSLINPTIRPGASARDKKAAGGAM
jgi:HlyD family secretion protein